MRRATAREAEAPVGAREGEKGVSELRGDDQARGRGQAGGGVHRDGRAEPLPVRDPGARAVVKGKWSW